MVQNDRCAGCATSGGGYAGTGGAAASTVVQEASIDTGQTLSTEPGVGAGVFIEYNQGGNWHVFTSCDSKLYGKSCVWNVVASVSKGQTVTNVSIESPEAADGDTLYTETDSVELAVETWNDLDGMRFNTSPGEVVRFDVYLGGERDARYIYWVGNNAIHKGAPSDPIDLQPTIP
jgi:hypothetical protein